MVLHSSLRRGCKIKYIKSKSPVSQTPHHVSTCMSLSNALCSHPSCAVWDNHTMYAMIHCLSSHVCSTSSHCSRCHVYVLLIVGCPTIWMPRMKQRVCFVS